MEHFSRESSTQLFSWSIVQSRQGLFGQGGVQCYKVFSTSNLPGVCTLASSSRAYCTACPNRKTKASPIYHCGQAHGLTGSVLAETPTGSPPLRPDKYVAGLRLGVLKLPSKATFNRPRLILAEFPNIVRKGWVHIGQSTRHEAA
eukprot:1101256-Amphidinium_carterae.1